MTSHGVFSAGAATLDRDGGEPLWSQLERELRRRMELGHFGARFPTDRELMEIYGVSRHTARHAVGQLGADGILRRARGVGTSVDLRTFERSLGSLYSLFQVVEESGVTQHSAVRRLELVRDPMAAERLGLDPDADLVLLDRIRYAGGEPLALDRVWLPAAVAAPLLDADFTHTSLYNELERVTGRRPNEGWERIHPAIPTRRAARRARPDRRRCRVLHRTPGHQRRRTDRVAHHGDPGRPLHLRRRLERRPAQRAAPPDDGHRRRPR